MKPGSREISRKNSPLLLHVQTALHPRFTVHQCRQVIEAATFNSLPMAKNLCTSSSLAPDESSHEPVELAESTPHQLFIESIVKFPKNY
jgi:hypothetical protein